MAATDSRDAVFDALADPTRRRLLTLVSAGAGVTATQLASELPVTRQAVSKHLGVLAGAGLVSAARDGREVRYSLTSAPLSDAVAWMTTVGDRWDERLDALRRELEPRA